MNLEKDYIDKGEITQGKQHGKISLKQDYIDKGEITQDKLENVIEIDRNRKVLFDYSAQMNTLEINTMLKKHPHSRPVSKGVYARNR